MVCIRFSAWSKTTERVGLEDLVGDLELLEPELLVDLRPTAVLEVVEGRQAVQELHVRIAGGAQHVRVDRVGPERVDPLGPDLLGLAHRHPHVGVRRSRTADALGDVLGERDARAGVVGIHPRGGDDGVGGPQRARARRCARPCRAGRR